jgi:hypothetical protein
MTEKLRSGVGGKVREAIEGSISRISVEMDGSVSLQMKPDGLLGLEGRFGPLWCRGDEPIIVHNIRTGTGRHRKTTVGPLD